MRKRILTIDIETGESSGDSVKLGFSDNVLSVCVYDGNRYRLFDDLQSCGRYLQSLSTNTIWIVYAHNGGKFDYKYLLRHFDSYSLVLNGGQFICAKWKSIEFRDSLNLFKTSLKKASQAFGGGIEKGSCPIGDWIPRKQMLDYLCRDCESLYATLEGFAKLLGIRPIQLKLTVASTSYNEFRQEYGKVRFRVDFPGLDTRLYRKLSDSYFGGRVEIFNMTLGGGIGLDVNSLYPSVLHSELYPCGYPLNITGFDSDLLGIYNVRITGYEDKSGIGQFPCKIDGKLLFPFGNFTSWITSADIKYFEDRKGLGSCTGKITFLSGFGFTGIRPFASFIDRLMRLKLSGGEGERQLAKYLMNSLYGKFAQKPEFSDIYITSSAKELSEKLSEGYSIVDDSGSQYWLSKEEVNERTKYIPVAVFVTSYARLVLQRAIHYLSDRGYCVGYCDTDSIFLECTENTIPKDIPGGLHESRLGAWKREIDFSGANFVLPKTYAIFGQNGEIIKVRAKGFPARCVADLEGLFRGVGWDGIVGLKTALRGSGAIVQAMNKQIRAVYAKREILPDGSTKNIWLE